MRQVRALTEDVQRRPTDLLARGSVVAEHSVWSVEELLERKGSSTVSVCVVARNDASTVGGVVTGLSNLRERGLIDEVVVMHHDSTDASATIAALAGAHVVEATSVVASHGPIQGKGDLLRRCVEIVRGDVIIWLDADLAWSGEHVVVGLLGPLLEDSEILLVRASTTKPAGGTARHGGQVTELLIRPVIAQLVPTLDLRQPLGGELAIRRDVARTLPFEPDQAVEIALVLDVATKYGAQAVAQVDVGERVHRARSVIDQRSHSLQVLRACLRRVSPNAPVLGSSSILEPLDVLRPLAS